VGLEQPLSWLQGSKEGSEKGMNELLKKDEKHSKTPRQSSRQDGTDWTRTGGVGTRVTLDKQREAAGNKVLPTRLGALMVLTSPVVWLVMESEPDLASAVMVTISPFANSMPTSRVSVTTMTAHVEILWKETFLCVLKGVLLIKWTKYDSLVFSFILFYTMGLW
jgi:hypothetical protein